MVALYYNEALYSRSGVNCNTEVLVEESDVEESLDEEVAEGESIVVKTLHPIFIIFYHHFYLFPQINFILNFTDTRM